jgi:hypothetical protein
LPSFSSIFQKKQRLTRSSGAELKRGGCVAAAIKDWVTGAESPACAAQSDRVRLPRRWFSCTFFSLVIIVMQCGPIDLVAVYPRQLN